MIEFKKINHPSGRRQVEVSLNLVTAKYTLMFLAWAIVTVWIFVWL